MTLKFTKPKLKFHTRSIIAGAFVLLICAAAYTDRIVGKDKTADAGNYLYTAGNEDKDNAPKILGEAAFVDNSEELPESANASAEDAAEAGSYDTYFSAMQVDRQRSRQQAYEMLQNVVDSAESMPDVKQKAYTDMMTIANNVTMESNIRSMVMAKGFEDCIAVINGDKLNVVVKTSGLLVNEVAQIKEIAVNESGFSAENVTVVEKND